MQTARTCGSTRVKRTLRYPALTPSTPGGSAAGDSGEDGHLVAVGDLGIQAVLEPDVLAGDVDVDEAAQIAVLGDPLSKPVVLLEDSVERLADGGSFDLKLALAAGDGAELGRDLHRD